MQTTNSENTAHLAVASTLTHQISQDLMLYLRWS